MSKKIFSALWASVWSKNKAGSSPGSAAVMYLIVHYYMFIDISSVPTAPLRVDFILLNDH